MILARKYRLLPSKKQRTRLAEIMETQRQLYNAALAERIDCYRKTGATLSYNAQSASLTQIRKDDPAVYGALPVTLSRATLRRLHRAYDGFFRRIKSGGKAGFPRFKSARTWSGFGFSEFEGISLDGARLRFKGFQGSVRVHMHRPMPGGKVMGCQFVRDAKGWAIVFQVQIDAVERRTVERAVGIDVGLTAFAYQSDGVAIPAPRIARRAHKAMRRRQRALARCRRGSARGRKMRAELSRLHSKIANARRTWLHQQSARIANSYDLIAVEDLKVANMLKNEHLARSISDAGWSTFTDMLAYKAEKAGKTFVKVDPKLTSQECSGCGVIVRKGLSDRVHNCPDCGLILDRDHNAALNILRRAVLRPGTDNVADRRKRRAGNLRVAK